MTGCHPEQANDLGLAKAEIHRFAQDDTRLTLWPVRRSPLHGLALAFALAGAAVALGTAAMVVASVVGRALWSAPIPGDVELTQVLIALAISLGLPWCQLHGGNIIVDFFTLTWPRRANRALDGIGALLVAAMCALLAWRTAAGALAVRDAGETSMILSLPMWWAYASLAPGLGLSACIAAGQAIGHFSGRESSVPEDTPAAAQGPVG